MNYTNCYKKVVNNDFFIYFFIGGRRIGKTYSMLFNCYKNKKKFLYLRRTESELQFCCNNSKNPFKKINANENINVEIKASKDDVYFYERNQETNEIEIVGYGGALSTSGKFRGSDYSDIDYIIFDEFIDTSYRSRIFLESDRFFNLIETVNSNREIEGKERIKIVMLSNSNSINNEILMSLKLGQTLLKMKTENIKLFKDTGRGIYLELLENKNIHDAKQETSLYKLTKGTNFYEMALENEFTNDYFGNVKKINYTEFIPIVSFEKMTFYKHKTNDTIFVSQRFQKSTGGHYTNFNKKGFMRDFGFEFRYYFEHGNMIFSNYDTKLEVQNLFSLGVV